MIFKKSDKNENLMYGYVDSDWAGDKVDRKLTAGYVFGCTVSWASRKQSAVALSSTEAEYVALSLATSEACWLRYLFKHLKIDNNYILVKLYEDNQSAIKV